MAKSYKKTMKKLLYYNRECLPCFKTLGGFTCWFSFRWVNSLSKS